MTTASVGISSARTTRRWAKSPMAGSQVPVQVIREIARLVKGGGGGRPDFAEAGGKEPEKLGEALDAGQELLLAALA